MKDVLKHIKQPRWKPLSYAAKCKQRGYYATAKEAQNKGIVDGNMFYFLVFGKIPKLPF